MTATIRRRSVLAALSLAVGLAAAGPFVPAPAAAAEPVTVFAAASLKGSLDEAVAAWQAETGGTTAISYAASSALAKQIEQGAPADVFISADLAWMDYLAERKLIAADTRVNLLGNRIVLVAPKDSTAAIEIAPDMPLAALLGDGKLAMGDPAAVPVGKYGKAALEKLGVWDSVAGKVAAAENVRAALLLVSRGEAPLGIVYSTDAAADPGVRVVATFPADTHPPIVYPVAVTADAKSAAAAAGLLAFLKGPKAQAIFAKAGFVVPE